MDRHSQTTGQPLSPAGREALICRITQSHCFQRSPRQRELLQFIAAEELAGRTADINEQHIGHRVFGRLQGYNQSDDNIVRVSVRQLRTRLQNYFDGEGAGEPWFAVIPRGAYRLEFHPRERVVEPVPAAPLSPHRWRPSLPPSAALAAVAVLFGVVCLGAGYWMGEVRPPAPALSLAPPAIEELLPGSLPVDVVVADSALLVLQAIHEPLPTVEDYTNRPRLLDAEDPSSAPGSSVHGLIDNLSMTSLGDVSFVERILQISGPFRDRVQVRHARNLNPRDLRQDNAVILGGHRVNPWAGLFEDRLNFRFQYRSAGPGCIHNQHPLAGERAFYGSCQPEDNGDYARIVWLPNLSRSGRVLIISGSSMLATESASDFLLAPGSATRLRAALRASSFGRIDSFELLLRIPRRAGVSTGCQLIAWRTTPSA